MYSIIDSHQCDQCENHATLKGCLKTHKKSKSLKVSYGLIDKIVLNDANVSFEDVSDVQSNETVTNKLTQNNETVRDILKENEKKGITDNLQQENIGIGCNKCDVVFRSKTSLSQHIRLVHKGVKYECNQCDYRATMQGILTRHI